MPSRIFILILLVFSSLTHGAASEADALAISRNIQNRHLVYGTVLDPVFASPTSNQIVSYSRCGDSAIWTGHYLAAEAFRYKVTQSPDALDNARRAVAGIKSLLDVTGNNVLARCFVPVDSPYRAAIESEEAHNGAYRSGPENVWIGNTSRDQYLGVVFGLGVAFDMIDDPEVKASIVAIVERIVGFLTSKNWFVTLPNGSITTTFLGRPDQKLSILQVARHISPNRFSTSYDIDRILLSATVIVPISVEVLDDNSYFKFNLDSITMYSLIRLESSSFGEIYRKAYDILRNHTDNHGNAFFNMIDRALNGPNPTRDAETRVLLDQWLQRPRRDVYVDLRTKVAACGAEDRACAPIPVPQRVTTDFTWQRSPFQMVGGGEGLIETAGIDYILPYWMARFYGVVEESGLRAVSSASGAPVVAPDGLASVLGAGLAPTTQIASTQPPPLSLGGISVVVRDSAGTSRSAPIYFVSPGQVNFVVPAGTAAGGASVAIQRTGAADVVASADVRAVAPGLISADGSGKGVAAATALRVAAGLQLSVPVYACGGSGCSAVPIDLPVDTPVYLSLFGTGIRNRVSLGGVTCTIGGVSAPVMYAGPQPAFAGLDQVNVALTSSMKGLGEVDLVVTVDGQASNAVRVSVR